MDSIDITSINIQLLLYQTHTILFIKVVLARSRRSYYAVCITM